jgi:hypothetical protein
MRAKIVPCIAGCRLLHDILKWAAGVYREFHIWNELSVAHHAGVPYFIGSSNDSDL